MPVGSLDTLPLWRLRRHDVWSRERAGAVHDGCSGGAFWLVPKRRVQPGREQRQRRVCRVHAYERYGLHGRDARLRRRFEQLRSMQRR